MIIIGIDPGLEGGIAAIRDGMKDVTDIPTITRQKTKGTKREYNISAMREMLKDFKRLKMEVRCALESVHAMPKQGVSSMFSMGEGLGIWKGLLTGLEIPFELITPQKWKSEMLNGTGHDKEASRLRAIQLFPALAEALKLKKDHGKAEALLLAEFYRRMLRQ